MIPDIYDPLSEYANVYKDKFKEVAEKTFAKLAKEANVDVEANKKTCSEIYATQNDLSSTNSSIKWWNILRIALWVVVVIGVIYAIVTYNSYEKEKFIIACVATIIVIVVLFGKIHPKLKELKDCRNSLEDTIDQLKAEAWSQMEPLNSLYDWDILARMMSETVPRLEFDPYFTAQRLADLQQVYGWDDFFNAERSVLYSHSGLINGNPFVLCRTKKMVMGSKTYHGSKTIYWTTTERGSDGKYHTVHHSETLHASYTAPYPEYYKKTRLIYANTAAPDLIFYRTKSGLAGKENSLSFKWKNFKLKRKSRKLENNDYAMMTNEEFEVAFDTSNRNNNHQFALLFTPLAQKSMLSLLSDKEVGFGDDFNFEKNRMINTITPDHLQSLDLDMDPQQYIMFDYEKAQQNFYNLNAKYFHAIYFSFAPLLCIPMYQQIRPQHDIYGHDMRRSSTFWEHEALANYWGNKYFEHSSCVTDCILKTKQVKTGDEESTINVTAYGYRSEDRVTYISKYGGDGRWHDVPVYWQEYIPVTGHGSFYIKEDNHEHNSDITQRERINHISQVLNSSNMKRYRRHIASKV